MQPVVRHHLHHMVSLPDHEFHCGLLFVQGAGFRVGVFTDGQLRHMSAAAARRLAKQYEAETEVATELAPVSDALRAMADRLDDTGVGGIEAEGNA